MGKLSRNAQVLRYLLEAGPGVGHTKLAKFAYLADLEAWKYLGEPISEFKYVLDRHGPFDARRFFSALKELEEGGYATRSTVQCGPYQGYEVQPTGKPVEYDFGVADAALLSYVATAYLSIPAKDLCEDVVYQTEPMKKVKKVGERIPMEKVKKHPDDKLGFRLERMLAGEQSAEAGRVRPLAEVLSGLRARLG